MSKVGLFAAIALVMPLTACSVESGGSGDVVFPAEALASMDSENGAFHVEVRTAPAQPPTRGEATIEYRVTGDDGKPRDGLTLTVVPWMPDMGHGASVAPVVTAEGGGRYVVSGVEMFMPGRWEMRTTIAGATQDHVTPTFQIP